LCSVQIFENIVKGFFYAVEIIFDEVSEVAGIIQGSVGFSIEVGISILLF
jgi:hypothetical protein